jgi:hypothetical protein
MAKGKSVNSIKTTFGKRKGGKARKNSGPKDKNKKRYVGQGRI